MEQRLIDANAYAAEMKTRQDACEEIMDAAKQDENWEVYDRMNTAFGVFVEAKLTLDNAPTVDAVPVVKCKECKYCIEVFYQAEDGIYPLKNICHKGHGFGSVKDDWFCADGERKDGADDGRTD